MLNRRCREWAKTRLASPNTSSLDWTSLGLEIRLGLTNRFTTQTDRRAERRAKRRAECQTFVSRAFGNNKHCVGHIFLRRDALV